MKAGRCSASNWPKIAGVLLCFFRVRVHVSCLISYPSSENHKTLSMLHFPQHCMYNIWSQCHPVRLQLVTVIRRNRLAGVNVPSTKDWSFRGQASNIVQNVLMDCRSYSMAYHQLKRLPKCCPCTDCDFFHRVIIPVSVSNKPANASGRSNPRILQPRAWLITLYLPVSKLCDDFCIRRL